MPVGWWFEDVINAVLFYAADCVVNIEDVLYSYTVSQSSTSRKLWKEVNYKGLEALFLRRHCIDAELKIYPETDFYFFKLLIIQMDAGSYRAYTDKLDKKTQRQVFLGIQDLVKKYYKPEYMKQLTKREQEITRAILNSKYKLWRHLYWG